jgi:UDP-sulfoquinovose synthase
MKVMVLGGDGYLGWPTTMYFSERGHDVTVVDSLSKRYWEAEMGVEPLAHTQTLHSRVKLWNSISGKTVKFFVGDIAQSPRFIYKVLKDINPDVIIHYAEQPSAPFSMQDRQSCVLTQQNNIVGTLNLMFAMQSSCPNAHLIKLGTMGEYGTPNIDIEEGWLDIEHNGRKDRVLYPKRPGSFYHLSKVHDSHNLEFGCRIWNMRVTDLNQGIVYGIDTDETVRSPELNTSYHYDSVFGTVLNRFIVQAVLGKPLTVYGAGGQVRGYLNIRDTLQCVELAALNEPDEGEFRVFNQITEMFSVLELAKTVQRVGTARGLDVSIDHIPNPRIELEDHYFNPKHTKLAELGLSPHLLTDEVVDHMLEMVAVNKEKIDPDLILPTIKWKKS